jgi:hypothetical protein
MTISNPDSSARVRISRRARVVGTLVAFGGLALGGFSLAAPASAAYLSSATFRADSLAEAKNWNKGWDACQKKNPQTKSVEFAEWSDDNYQAIWACFDDPNKSW